MSKQTASPEQQRVSTCNANLGWFAHDSANNDSFICTAMEQALDIGIRLSDGFLVPKQSSGLNKGAKPEGEGEVYTCCFLAVFFVFGRV